MLTSLKLKLFTYLVWRKLALPPLLVKQLTDKISAKCLQSAQSE